jgi:oligopeptide/dipeptide ABC transporter, ATP-binding protein, C-terminal domain
MTDPILELENLRTSFKTDAGIVRAVRGATLSVERGESVGIVGESGSGKTVSMLSAMRLLPQQAAVEADKLRFNGVDILRADSRVMRSIAGKDIGFVFQDPMTSLNPLLTVGDQLSESMKLHLGITGKAARERAIEILKLVEIPEPAARLRQYPFEFSGGMRQRVMIAIAIACKPKLIIADEPTTALDVTIQAQILALLKGLKDALQTSIVLISHDMGVIASMCTKVFVMYGGRVVESGTVDEIFYEKAHPYAEGLLGSIPEPGSSRQRKLVPIPGSPPDLIAPPSGCAFAARCAKAMKVCALAQPPVTRLSETHAAECWLLDGRARMGATVSHNASIAGVRP